MTLSLLPLTPPAQTADRGRNRLQGVTEEARPEIVQPLFELGEVVMTIEFAEWLEEHPQVDPTHFVLAHVLGMWDGLHPHDRRANREALKDEARIVSTYPAFGEKVLVITAADRSHTVVNLLRYY